MTTFVLIAVFGSIGLTLLLASILWRINRPRGEGDGGAASANAVAPHDADGGDGGGGD